YIEIFQDQDTQQNIYEESIRVVTQFQNIDNDNRKVLNIALELECADELINIINHFIDHKKNATNESNQEQILQNVFDSNPYIRSLDYLNNTSTSRVPFKSVNINKLYNTNKSSSIANANNDSIKRKYVCHKCEESGHNARSCNKLC
ncbi:34221_t:CDS:2, partial [Gigaspora margarita]